MAHSAMKAEILVQLAKEGRFNCHWWRLWLFPLQLPLLFGRLSGGPRHLWNLKKETRRAECAFLFGFRKTCLHSMESFPRMVIAGHRLVGGASRNNLTVHPGQLTWHHDRRFQARRMSLVKQKVRRVDVYNRGRQNKLDCRESFKAANVKMSKSRKHGDKSGRVQMF